LHVATELTFEQLALVETLAIGCHATNRAAPQPDEWCLIIGAGPIGLATLEFVKLTGANVIVLDVNEQRLDFCRRIMGVRHTVVLSDRIEQSLREVTEGHLPDVVFDATGHSGSMASAFGLIAQGGRLVFVGLTTDEVKFRPAAFHRVEGTLLSSRNAVAGEFRHIIGLIEGGRIDTRPWITHRAAFEEVGDVFPSYTRPETGVIKAVVAVGD
jgi:alcohol dehydrogenase